MTVRPPAHTASASVIQSPTAAPEGTFYSVNLRKTLRQNMRSYRLASFLRWLQSEAILIVSSANTRHSTKKLITIKTIFGNIKDLHVLHIYICVCVCKLQLPPSYY